MVRIQVLPEDLRRAANLFQSVGAELGEQASLLRSCWRNITSTQDAPELDALDGDMLQVRLQSQDLEDKAESLAALLLSAADRFEEADRWGMERVDTISGSAAFSLDQALLAGSAGVCAGVSVWQAGSLAGNGSQGTDLEQVRSDISGFRKSLDLANKFGVKTLEAVDKASGIHAIPSVSVGTVQLPIASLVLSGVGLALKISEDYITYGDDPTMFSAAALVDTLLTVGLMVIGMGLKEGFKYFITAALAALIPGLGAVAGLFIGQIVGSILSSAFTWGISSILESSGAREWLINQVGNVLKTIPKVVNGLSDTFISISTTPAQSLDQNHLLFPSTATA